MGAYSKLHEETYRRIKAEFPELSIRENIRPDWLMSERNTKLEIDIFLEKIDVAIEIQGIQHYEFTPRFHKTYADFQAQQNRDQQKRDLCRGRGIKLVEIAGYADLNIFISDLKERYKFENKMRELALSWGKPSLQNLYDEDFHSKYAKVREKTSKPQKSLMRNPKYRRWAKRKKLQKLGLYTPPPAKEKLPGNHRQRNNARNNLSAYQRGDEWIVWGGRTTHIVNSKHECDCEHSKSGKICTHILRVKIEVGEI